MSLLVKGVKGHPAVHQPKTQEVKASKNSRSRARAKIASLEAQLQSRAFEAPVQRPASPRYAPRANSPRDKGHPVRKAWLQQQPPMHNGVPLGRDQFLSCAKKNLPDINHDFRTCQNYLGADAAKILRAVQAAQKAIKENGASVPTPPGSTLSRGFRAPEGQALQTPVPYSLRAPLSWPRG